MTIYLFVMNVKQQLKIKQIHNFANDYMMTPVKVVKNQSETIVQRDKAANDLYSTAVSKIRQPIETLFNWLIEKTDI